ncbi:hypothetical protein [Flavobacterium sp.]
MRITEANIEIIRQEGKLVSVSVAMPIWDKVGDDNILSVNIPLFGIKTFAENEFDADIAIKEVLTAFCINSEKFGNGLENVLKIIGWSFNERNENFCSMSFSVSNNNSVIDQIMQTGEQVVQKLELIC